MLNEREWKQEKSHTQGTESISVPNTLTKGTAIRNRGSWRWLAYKIWKSYTVIFNKERENDQNWGKILGDNLSSLRGKKYSAASDMFL